MSKKEKPSYEELQQRLAAAEAALQALGSGEGDSATPAPQTPHPAALDAHAAHITQVLLAIRKVNQLIVAADDPLRLIEQACATLTHTMGYFNAWIALIDTAGVSVTATASAGFDNGFDVLENMLAAGACPDCLRRALATEALVVIQDPRQECERCPLVEEYAGRAGLSCRLHHGGITYGTLSVSVPAAYACDEQEQELFTEIAGDLAFGLHKIEAARQLRESRAMLARTERIAQIGSWEWEIAGDRVCWSEELFRIFQLDPAEGAPSFREQELLYVAEDMARLRRAVAICQQSGTPYTLDLRVIRPDGHIRHCLVHGRAVRDARGQIHRLVGSLQDITDRRMAEEALRMEHERLSFIIEGSGLGTWVWNVQTNEIILNDRWAAMVGYTLAELSPYRLATWEQLVHPEDLQHATELLARCIHGEQPAYECELRMRHRQGHWVWVLDRGRIMARDDDGKPLSMFGTHTDITRLKLAEEAVREASMQLQESIRAANIGLWDWDLLTNRVRYSREWKAQIGYREEEIGNNYDEWASRVHPEDLEPTLAKVNRAIADAANFYHVEFRFRHRDGSYRWILTQGSVYRDHEGRPVRVLGSHLDITERKRTEEALQQSEQRFRSFVENANDIVFATTAEGVFTYVSPQWRDGMGEPAETAIGRCFEFYVHPMDAHLCWTFLQTVLTTNSKQSSVEYRVRRADGTWRWHVSSGSPLVDANGKATGFLGIARDVTERKKAEETIQARERYLQTILQTSPDGFWVLDAQGTFIEVNEAYLTMSGYSRSELLGLRIGDVDAIETAPETVTRIGHIIAHGSELFETRHRRKDGSIFPVEVAVTWLDQDKGRFICFCRDLSERERREQRLVLLGQMLDAAPASITIHDTKGRFLFANTMTAALHGYDDKSEFAEINLHDLDIPESRALLEQRFAAIAQEGEAHFEVAHYRKDGTAFPLEVVAKAIEWEGQPAVLSIATDITARKRAEQALRESEERNRLLSDLTMEGIVLHHNGVAEDVNASVTRMLGYRREELLHRDFIPFFHVEDLPVVRENIGKDYAPPYIVRMQRRSGDFFPVEIESYNFQRSGETWRVSALRDVSERVRIQEELRRSEHHLQQIFEILPIGLWFADKHGTLLRGNPMGVRIWGAEPKVPISEYGRFKAWRLPSREPVQADEWALVQTIRTGATIVDELLEIEAFDGKRKTILNYSAPIVDDSGQIDGAIVVNLDISDRKALEEQLLQAHKMESVGRLAGGVAHDFNNMLGVILGYAEMALEQVEEHQAIHKALRGIRQAAQRSAALTRQLLAFARKQTVAPKVLDLNDTVAGMLSMLRRLIGEDIDLAWLPGDDLWPVKMDPAQIDQVLANLCVNGRDAIAGVGKITIETGNITLDAAYCSRNAGFLPGEYILLAVSDNGKGMDRETLAHLFEPFYTTKETGKGTGLGLAMIYGIVRQNHGFVNVYSEPGQGTTFKIYLPRYTGTTESQEEHAASEPASGRETILLVEDEPMILEMTVAMLERLGYTVLAAATPHEAITLAAQYSDTIDLLITDVVMPTMNGRELAAALAPFRPHLKRLFMSGYTANVIAHHGVLDPGVHFMQKPFSRHDLATKVREALEAAGDHKGQQ
jgi:PAS domain S-box-containing protein